jgi:hypothetical protein
LCLEDDVLLNIIGEEMLAGLWSIMESLYMKTILEKLNLLEEETIQLMNEGMY